MPGRKTRKKTLRAIEPVPVPPLTVRPLRPGDWPAIEALFGENGACGGCWCMSWRLPRGGRLWEENKGEKNRRAFRALVKAGRARGALAFAGDEPVGWCSIGPREDYPRLLRSRVLPQDAPPGTWAVTCFFVRPRWRGRSVATALLREAVAVARRGGASSVEGYPVVPWRLDAPAPHAFVWTGVPRLFERLSFRKRPLPPGRRPVYRRSLRPGRATPAKKGAS